jgi:hypothetical protein
MTATIPTTPTTRDEALDRLVAAGERVAAAFAPLSDAQWTWSPDAKTWSAHQIAEHLVIIDEMTTKLLGDRFSTFAEASFTDEQRAKKDAMLPRATADRGTKIEAPEAIRPTGRYASRAGCLAAFAAARATLVANVRSATVDFRSRARPHPVLGTLDGIQWLLFCVAHGDRHLAQLAELRAHPGFPAA